MKGKHILNSTWKENTGGDGGKIERKLSEVNVRTVSRKQRELIGKFNMAAGDVISIEGSL